jgi:hypothetical protein
MRELAAKLPELAAEAPHVQDALGIRHLPPERQIVFVPGCGRWIPSDRDSRRTGTSARHTLIMSEFSMKELSTNRWKAASPFCNRPATRIAQNLSRVRWTPGSVARILAGMRAASPWLASSGQTTVW